MRNSINQPFSFRCFLALALFLMPLGMKAQDSTNLRWRAPNIQTNFVEVNEWTMDWSARTEDYPILVNNFQVSVNYSSSDTGVATIDANGVITPVAPGTTTISASFDGDSIYLASTASYTLTYTDDREDMEIAGAAFSSSTASATYGDATVNTPTISTGKLGNAAFTYSSSDEDVATVDNSGNVSIEGAGTAEIKASFAGNDNFKPGYLTYTLMVTPKEVELTWGTTEFTYDGSAQVPTATATGLVGSDACNVTVEGAQTDAGSNYTATATGLSNGNYQLPAANTTINFSIAKAASSVTKAPTANTLTYTDSAQALVTAGEASGGTMQYSLDDQTFAEAIPTGTEAGDYTVYYKVVGDKNHENAAGDQVPVTIAKADATVAFVSPMVSAKIGETYAGQTATTTPAGLTLTYSSSSANVATVDASSGTVTLVAVGSTTITATFAGNDNYNEASASYTLTVTKADAVSSDLSLSSATATATYGDETVSSPALNNPHQLPLTWDSSNKDVATVDGSGTVTIVGAGEAIISAAFAGNDNFKPDNLTYTLTVVQKEVGLMWGTTEFTYDGSAHAPMATATGLVGSDACNVTVGGEQTDAGSYTATATGLSNDNYKLPADNTTTFSIAKAASSVTKAPTANTLTYTGSSQALVMAGEASGGTMQYSLDNQTFAEAIPTGTEAGDYTVYYKVVGDKNHENAAGDQVPVTIAKADATVAFVSPMVSAKIGETYAGQTATTTPAGLTLTYSSSSANVATVDASSGTVTLVAVGSTTITATFAGNDNYNEASASYTLTVAKADAVSSDLSFSSATATATYGDETVSSPALNNPHQLSLTWDSSNKDVATVNASGVVTIVGAGEVVISATFAGNDDYIAKTISYTLTVNKFQPKITFASTLVTAKLGEDFTSPKISTDPKELELVYTSSDENVARVDANSGEVTIVGIGTARITATLNATQNYHYVSAYYDLTVKGEESLLDPIEEDRDYKMEAKYFINDDGTEVDLSNVIINDILFTLKNQDSPEGDGYDPDLDCIVLNTVVAASAVNSLVEKGLLPGTDEYAAEFTGLTFLMPAGEGEIIVTSQELNGVYLMVKVGKEKPVLISMPEMGDYSIPYKSNTKTYVYLWNGGTDANSTRGKKSMTDARVRNVSYKKLANGIQPIVLDTVGDQPWYDLSGRPISKPVKKGIYIHGNRKVVIK